MGSAVIQPAENAAWPSTVSWVDASLRAVLAAEQARWAAVDPWLAEPLTLLTDFVLAGGKRLRPAFCVFGFLGAGGSPEQPGLFDLAAALELLHAFALLHDDVMDGSDRRRGHLSVHRQLERIHGSAGWGGESRRFGEGMAVLLGDLALTLADRLLAAADHRHGGLRATWDELRLELVMGQYLDLAGAARGAARGGIGYRRAIRIARYKSGAYTVERPLHLGAALAGRLDEMQCSYTAFGRPLGEAFQLRDDLLGTFGREAVTGKPVGDDLREGKPTVLLALAREYCGLAGAPLLDRVGSLDLSELEIRRLRRLFVECGARDEVERLIRQRHARAVSALGDMALPSDVRASLGVLADQALWRSE